MEDRSSMSDTEGSNALVSVVQFYSQALAASEAARRQAEQLVRQLVNGRPPDKVAQAADYVVRAANAYIVAQHHGGATDRTTSLEELEEGVLAYRRTRNEVDGVEPDPSREGAIRGAHTVDAPDVPRPGS